MMACTNIDLIGCFFLYQQEKKNITILAPPPPFVECHYNENCTYESVRETSSIKYWIRKCVCRRKLSEKEVTHYLNTDIRKETKHGRGGPWYELSWIKYDGPNFSNLAGR